MFFIKKNRKEFMKAGACRVTKSPLLHRPKKYEKPFFGGRVPVQFLLNRFRTNKLRRLHKHPPKKIGEKYVPLHTIKVTGRISD